MTTPNYLFPEIAEGQASKHLTHNEALRMMEVALGTKAQSAPINTPPSNPVEGTLYIVGNNPLDAWVGRAKNLALRINNFWLFVPPSVSLAPIYSKAENNFYHYNGTDWVQLVLSSSGALPTNIAYLDIAQQFTKTQGNTTVNITEATSISVDASASNKFNIVLSGNRALVNPINLKDATYIFTIKQDATGSRTLTYGSSFKFPGGVVPALSTAPNAVDELYCNSDGNVLRCVLNKDYK